MTRKTYVYDEELKKVVPKDEYIERRGQLRQRDVNAPMVMGDIESFRSPVDGSVIIGRKSLRDHNRRNNVVDTREVQDSWAGAAERRKAELNSATREARAARIEALKHAYDKHRK